MKRYHKIMFHNAPRWWRRQLHQLDKHPLPRLVLSDG